MIDRHSLRHIQADKQTYTQTETYIYTADVQTQASTQTYADRHIHRQTDGQTQIGRQADRQTDTDKQTDRHTHGQKYRLTDRHIGICIQENVYIVYSQQADDNTKTKEN